MIEITHVSKTFNKGTVNEKRGFFGGVSHFRHIHPL